MGCAIGFWHSLAKIVAVVCDRGSPRSAGLTETSYNDPRRQNLLAHPTTCASYPAALTVGNVPIAVVDLVPDGQSLRVNHR